MDEAAVPATEFAAFARDPVVMFTPREFGAKLPRKLLHGPLWEPVEPADPSDPADPED